jgi:quercetin dioxygenase-like cupin family protein
MTGVRAKGLGSPDTTRVFVDGSMRGVVDLNGVRIGRGVYKPGWRWSQHVQPLLGKPSSAHTGYVISGRMVVRASDGTEAELGPGDAFVADENHDAWVLGDEPCVALDFHSS